MLPMGILLASTLVVSVIALAQGAGEAGQEGPAGNRSGSVPASSWRPLAAKRIFFAHQSVGYNILDGIRDLAATSPDGGLRIVEGSEASLFDAPVLAHARLGRNGDPGSKVRAWERYLESGIGSRADFALYKFCYLDVVSATDARQVFEMYRTSAERLKGLYPKTTFIHVTVPLTTVQSGVKAALKRLLGRPLDGYAENAKRNEYNELLRSHYEGREPVFDLARIESASDGGTTTYELQGRRYSSLTPAYTDDGGHLNAAGRRRAAENLLGMLAQLAARR